MGGDKTMRPQQAAASAIELRGISKAFGPVQANKDISINGIDRMNILIMG